eukprot:gnl/TRDRNA2_/TRDRNA2_29160_c0_seq1.p1 gnl/TRDRNA2_/TRDRNA2_29160_c0~~gnl/TRDRNA2_/TRDRNA2_29160_c0_seq1.p1  ORF type:complete len:260 (+),score=24.47 gnl/TRDRNA2_/TRDRNA2_29160_c0_seq1:110-889(+)
MITFLPYPDFRRSLECLDLNRLRAQRREARDILRLVLRRLEYFDEYHRQTDILHPAVVMWEGFAAALLDYYRISLEEYAKRGHKNGCFCMEEFEGLPCHTTEVPPWFGSEELHKSHRIKLFTKLPDHYRQYGWEAEVMDVLGSAKLDEFRIRYVWPHGAAVWKAYRAERQRLARENPAAPEVKARVRSAYQSWSRCKICRSAKHRQHNCPRVFRVHLRSPSEGISSAARIFIDEDTSRSPSIAFKKLKRTRVSTSLDLA